MLTDFLYRLRAVVRRESMDGDLDEELGFHLQQQMESNMRAGMPRDAALRDARLAISGVEQLKEDCRDARGMRVWDSTAQDLRHALRQMRRGPAFTLAVVLTIGLGIGATTALFTVADAALFRPLPVQNPGALVTIARNRAQPYPLHSLAEYLLIRDESRGTFAGVTASNSGNAVGFSTLDSASGDVPAVVSAAFVANNYFEVLGVGAAVGRVLAQADERAAEENPPVVLSYEFWQRRFGGSRTALGRTVRVNAALCTIAGVARRGFRGTMMGSVIDLYVPLRAYPAVLPMMRRNWNAPRRQWLVLIARLQPGVSAARAADQVDSLVGDKRGARAVLLPAGRGLGPISQLSQPVMILLSAAGLLLALACANVAGLLLARSLQRQREIALRLALGAGRSRLIRQLLTESLLLAFTGGVVGLLAGMAGARALVRILPSDGPLPFLLDVSADARVFGFAFAVTLATGLIFGLGPALRAARWDLAVSIKGSAIRLGTARWLRFDARRALVGLQVSLSLVLLVGVALLARSLAHLQALNLGYSRTGLLFVYVQPSQVGYEGSRVHEFYEGLRSRIAALPGVKRTSLADYAPLDGGNDSGTVAIPGRDGRIPVETNTVSDGYLATLGISLVAGRDLVRQDAIPGGLPVALINESLARLISPNESPVGRRLVYGDQSGDTQSMQIVGVVRDARYAGLRERPAPMVYTPLDPALSRLVLCVRTADAPQNLIPAVRREVAAMDAAVPVVEAATMEERVDRENAGPRLLAMLLSVFGSMALLLAAIGLHGVLAFGVAARTREIGIRSALGARRWDAVAGVLRDVSKLVGAGAAMGALASLALARLLAAFLFGVQPFDAVSFGVAIGMLAATAALASYVPARRAALVDPSVALRHE